MNPIEYERLSFQAQLQYDKEKKEIRKLFPSLKKSNAELKKENEKEKFNLKKNISINRKD